MSYIPETKPGLFSDHQPKRRLSLEEVINLRRSSVDGFNTFNANEAVAMGPSANDRRRGHSAIVDVGFERVNVDAGFAAIELLRPPSPSLDDHQKSGGAMDEEDTGDFGPSLQAEGNGVDLSCTTLEDLLYELQKEIVSVVSRLDASNDLGHSSVDNSRKFIWSARAKNLLETAILKLHLRHEEDTDGCYSAARESTDLETLNSVLLPLWPDGWMSPSELNQAIQRFSAGRLEDSIMNDDNADANDYYAMAQDFDDDDHLRRQLSLIVSSSQSASSNAIPIFSEPNVETPSSTSLDRGQRSDNGQDCSMCFICDRSFQNAHMLKIHISQMHTPKALACPQCQSRHSTLSGLRYHFSTKHKGLSQRFLHDLVPSAPAVSSVPVPLSGSSDQSGVTATAYISSSNEARNQLRSSASLSNVSGSASNTSDSGDLECSSCKTKFPSTGTLKAHISMMHTEKSVRCRYCPNLYATQRAMLQHVYLKHHKERNSQCPQCGETFKTAGLANLHRRYGHCGTAASSVSSSSSSNNNNNKSSFGKEISPFEIHGDPETRKVSGSGGSASGLNAMGRGNDKYHCRDCGAGFPMPSAVWVHRKKEHRDSTSIKRRGGFSVFDPKRNLGGQIFGHDALRQSKDGKKKMHVKCSVCSAIFSNGYACYLHKKKIHGEESIRRELNLSDKPSTTTNVNPTTSAKLVPPKVASSMDAPARSFPVPNVVVENVQHPTSGEPRISTSSSSSRDSSPFYRSIDGSAIEGLVRRRYEFHCQCGMTFYNGFAFSRHRQRTGCSDGVRGVLIKESLCGVCSEAFASAELLNEHFLRVHGCNASTSAQSTSRVNVASPLESAGDAADVDLSADFSSTSVLRGASARETDSSGSGLSVNRKASGVQRASVPQSATKQFLGATASTSEAAGEVASSSAEPGVSSISLDRMLMRCQLCPYETLSIDALDEHRRRHGKPNIGFGQQASNLCPYCSYNTDSVSSFVRHTALHFSHSDYKLDTEPAAAVEPKTRGNQRLECTYCGRPFQNVVELMEHEFMHTGGRY